jgi:hypothetical protein
MSLQRTCYLCGKPVSIRRHMSLFCSPRCEQRHRVLAGAPRRGDTAPPRDPAPDSAVPPLPDGTLPPRPVRSSRLAPRR